MSEPSLGLHIPNEDKVLLGGAAIFIAGLLLGNTDIEAAGAAIALGGKGLGSITTKPA